MDPNATLRYIDDLLDDPANSEEADYYCLSLRDWLRSGGFSPDWSVYPEASARYLLVVSPPLNHAWNDAPQG